MTAAPACFWNDRDVQAVHKPCLLCLHSPGKLHSTLQGLLGQTQQTTGAPPGSLRPPLQGHLALAALMTGQAGASPKGAEMNLRTLAKVIFFQGTVVVGREAHSECSRSLS